MMYSPHEQAIMPWGKAAMERLERQRRRTVKHERKHAQYRADEQARVQASLKKQGLTNNVNDKCWENVA